MLLKRSLWWKTQLFQRIGILLGLMVIVEGGIIPSSTAQSITPARDGTNTRIRQEGNQFEIEGGQRSSDGSNLFHSFERFGLSQNQVATFLSDPSVRNVLGRIIGGEPSYIDGLLRLSGGNANLFLINPMGIVLGANARLDLPAAFTATTATGIRFNDGWLSASGNNDYAALVGDPQQFAFALTQPGIILNAGNLTVNPAQSITLLGGIIINTGTLTAPGGTITVAAIPGEHRVRISQEGSLVSLDLEAIAPGSNDVPNSTLLTPPMLPALLTGGTVANANTLIVNPDGTIRLSATTPAIPLQAGTAIASGTIDTSTSQALTPEINILGDRVAVIDATVNGAGVNGGGILRIGGDYQGQGGVFNATQTYVSTNSTLSADALTQGDGGRIIVWADDATAFYGAITATGGALLGNGGFAEVSGKRHLMFQGTAELGAANGSRGTLLLDPTTIFINNSDPETPGVDLALPGIFHNEFPGSSVTISQATLQSQALANTDIILQADDGIIIGTLDSQDISPGSGTDIQPSLIFAGGSGRGLVFTADANNDGIGSFVMNSDSFLIAPGRNIEISGATISAGNIISSNTNANSGSILLTTTGDILVSTLDTTTTSSTLSNIAQSGDITIISGGNFTASRLLRAWSQTSRGGNVTVTAAGTVNVFDVETFIELGLSPSSGDSGSVIINAGRDINVTGVVNASNAVSGTQGDIRLTANSGSINVVGGQLATIGGGGGFEGRGGNISLTAANDIILGGDGRGFFVVDAGGTLGAGNIELRSSNGRIEIAGTFNVSSTGGNGGRAILTANNGSILTSGIIDSSASNGNGGAIELTAPTITTSNITTTGSTAGGTISFNGAVVVNTDATLNTSSTNRAGDISFDNLVSGDRTLTINAGNSGTVSFQDEVNIGSLNVTSAGNTTVADNITTTNQSLIINSPVTINASSVSFDAGTGDIAVDSGITATNNALNLSGNNITLSDFTGDRLTATANDAIAINGTTNSNQLTATANNITLSNFTGDQLRATANEAIAINGTINSNQLNLTADSINLTGAINSNQSSITTDNLDISNTLTLNDTLLLQTRTSTRDVTLGAEETGTLSLSQAEINNLRGTGLLTIGRTDATGNISVVDDLLFNTAVSLIPGSGNILLGSSITTSGHNLTLGNTILTDNATLSTGTTQGNLTLNGTVNSRQNPNYTLSLNAGDTIQVNRSIGAAAQSLNTLSFDADQTLLGGDLYVSSGNLVFNHPVTLTNNVTLQTLQGDIRFADTLNSVNGANDLALTAPNGNVALQGSVGNSTALGDITIASAQNVAAQSTINADSLQYRNGTRDVTLGGDITTRGADGVVIQTTGDIRAGNITTAGGAITLQSDRNQNTAVITGNLNTSTINGNGGAVTIEAGDRITTGAINTSSINGNGGAVFLDPRNDIQVTSINTQSQTQRGGNITATTQRFFLANGSFTALNNETASLSAMGSEQGGNITISHYGGARLTPFAVGNATSNGTAAAILSGTVSNPNTIAPLRSFPGPYRQPSSSGDIALLTQSPPTLPETEALSPFAPHQELQQLTVDILLDSLEIYFTQQVTSYLGIPNPPIKSVETIQHDLGDIERATGIKPAVIYAVFLPQVVSQSPETPPRFNTIEQANDELNLILVMPRQDNEAPVEADSSPTAFPGVVWVRVPGVARQMAVDQAIKFRQNLLNDFDAQTRGSSPNLSYLDDAQALYRWLVEPLDAVLRDRGIQNLTFILDSGLRRIPLAALHDGQSFIIERYSVGLMPSFSLTDTRYESIKTSAVLAAGSALFQTSGLDPLPAVPDELLSITQAGWRTRSLLNAALTRSNLIQARQQQPFGIIHLATHADFLEGEANRSYIQLWDDERIGLDEVRNLGWNNPPVRLLVLSACDTAEGNETVELGFAGMAVQTQVESVLASIWRVRDWGTLALMAEFYQQLHSDGVTIKAEALRQAQLSLLRGELGFNFRQLQGSDIVTFLPYELSSPERRLLSHPRLWSGFTIVGSPW